MPYAKWNKNVRIKDRGDDGSRFSWTVASAFAVAGGEKKVTVILGNPPQNTFYQKHILRYGEDNSTILAVRKSGQAATFNAALMQFGEAFDIKTTGAPASTVIDISKINFNAMLYEIASALHQARANGKMPVLATQYHVDIEFSQNCVSTVRPGGAEKWYSGMTVGTQVVADDGAGRMTFDVNHCAGAN